jgi:hypothetical protein
VGYIWSLLEFLSVPTVWVDAVCRLRAQQVKGMLSAWRLHSLHKLPFFVHQEPLLAPVSLVTYGPSGFHWLQRAPSICAFWCLHFSADMYQTFPLSTTAFCDHLLLRHHGRRSLGCPTVHCFQVPRVAQSQTIGPLSGWHLSVALWDMGVMQCTSSVHTGGITVTLNAHTVLWELWDTPATIIASSCH